MNDVTNKLVGIADSTTNAKALVAGRCATDSERELLELAAKAVGKRLWIDTNGRFWGNSEPWNPLTDDGNALRLAVKLRLWVRDGEAQDGHDIYAAEDGDDRYAATRRAIVRAAAEIARRATTGDTHD